MSEQNIFAPAMVMIDVNKIICMSYGYNHGEGVRNIKLHQEHSGPGTVRSA